MEKHSAKHVSMHVNKGHNTTLQPFVEIRNPSNVLVSTIQKYEGALISTLMIK
jgi:hypothetical protein